MEKNERCDEESVVFNARVNEDEMIITIKEYESLKAQINYLKNQDEDQFNLRQRVRQENLELRQGNDQLKKGIIEFVKLIGGLTND